MKVRGKVEEAESETTCNWSERDKRRDKKWRKNCTLGLSEGRSSPWGGFAEEAAGICLGRTQTSVTGHTVYDYLSLTLNYRLSAQTGWLEGEAQGISSAGRRENAQDWSKS